MVTNPEMLDLNLETSESIIDRTRNLLSSFKKEVEQNPGNPITKAPEKWTDPNHPNRNLVLFDYNKKWEIVTEKAIDEELGEIYKVRIKEMGTDGKWYTLKFGDEETYNFAAANVVDFNKQLGEALDEKIGKNREKVPETGKVVYNILNQGNEKTNSNGNQGNEKLNPNGNQRKIESHVTRDSKYEKDYGVSLIRDGKLIFYIVKKGEGLGIIKQKLSKIPEFSYLSHSDYDIDRKGNRNIHGFNTPNSSLVPGFYLPIPLKREDREISDSKFKSCAKKAIDQMENDSNYGDKVKELLKNVKKNDIASIMAAFARSESSDDHKTFSFPIGSAELHRREPRYKAYSFSYFHILMGSGPGMNARKKLGLTEGDCYDPTNACKLFLGYCFEKVSNPNYFFKINSLEQAKKVGKTYNGSSSYGNKLWDNIKYCKKK